MQPEFPIDALARVSSLIDNGMLSPSVAEDLRIVTEYAWKARSQQARSQAVTDSIDTDVRFLSEPLMDQIKAQFSTMKSGLEAVGMRPTSGILEKLIVSHDNLSSRCRSLVSGLFMYADPLSYRAGGEFSADTSIVTGSVFQKPVPGRQARTTLFGNESIGSQTIANETPSLRLAATAA